MVLQPPQASVCSSSQSLGPSSGVAQLEAEISLLGEALTPRQQIEWRAYWLSASRSLLSESGRSLPTKPTTETVALLRQN